MNDRRQDHRDKMRDKKLRDAALYRKMRETRRTTVWLEKEKRSATFPSRTEAMLAIYAPGSLANKPHLHKREIARRLRQQAARS